MSAPMTQYNKPRRIKENKAQCLICKDIIESKTRHDFKRCSCGNLFVDGGKDYVSRGANDTTKYKELSTFLEDV